VNGRSEVGRPQPIVEPLQQIEAEIPRLRRYARHLGYEPAHADDLVRECLVAAVAEIPTAIANIRPAAPDRSLRGWLFGILRNGHIDRIRRGQRLDGLANTRGEAASPTGHNQEAGAALSELRDAYFSLSEEHREVLLLVVTEELQHEEAVAILQVPLGTVRSRLSQARHALRQALEAQGPLEAVGRTALASLPASRMQGISA
jgi:RNA polymerase sigma-70 factor (ECF subfamily)